MTRYGLFCYSSFAYAVPLLSMQKILHQCSGYLLPLLPPLVAEILVDNGQLVPLLKLAQVTGLQEASARAAEYKVLAGSEAGTVALPAEVACGIVAEQKGTMLPAEDEAVAGVVGTFTYQDNEYHVLNIDQLAMAMTEQVAK